MSGKKIQIPVEASFDTQAVDAELEGLVKKFNKVGQALAKANQLKFNPLDAKATWATFDKMGAELEKLTSKSKKLRDEIARTGQSHLMAHEIDFDRLTGYSSRARSALHHAVFSKAIQGTGAGFQYVPGQPHATGAGGLLSGAARQIGGAALGAMGPAGRVASGALSTGMSSGAVAGLAGLGAGLAALAVGKAISAVTEQVDANIQENIRYSKIRHQLGSVGVGFNALKAGVRGASASMGLSFEDGQDLFARYIRRGNVSGADLQSAIGEVSTAGNMARGFGIDQGEAVNAFGALRKFGVTSNDQDVKKAAILFGEAVAKSGHLAQSSEFLEAIAAHVETSARSGMDAPDLARYMAQLSGMAGSKIPGLDVQGSAAMIGKIDAAFRQGGIDEGGKNFMYRTLGRSGWDPFDVKVLENGGMFATPASTFGPDSVAGRWHAKYHIPLPAGALTDTKDSYTKWMEGLDNEFSGRGDVGRKLQAAAIAHQFQMNEKQAMALMLSSPANIGSLMGRLGKLGINIKNVNDTGIAEMAQAEGNDSLTEEQKNKAIREAAEKGMQKDPGDLAKDQIAELKNIRSLMADHLVPAVTAMKDGILWLAGGSKGMTLQDIRQKMAQADAADRVKGIMAAGDDKQRAVLEQMEEARKMPAGPERTKRMDELNGDLNKIQQEQRDAVGAVNNSPAAKFNQRAQGAMDYFVSKGWTREQAAGIVGNLARESSSFDPGAVGDNGEAYGIAQWHADRQAKFKKWAGKDIRGSTLEEQLGFIHHELTEGDEVRAGNRLRQARTARSAGEVVSRMYERPAKQDSEASLRGGMADEYLRMTPMPDVGDANRPGDREMRHRFDDANINITLQDPRGNPLAPPVSAEARVSSPNPSGVRQ